jgi:transcriptional regulator with XRE-family HTH domain
LAGVDHQYGPARARQNQCSAQTSGTSADHHHIIGALRFIKVVVIHGVLTIGQCPIAWQEKLPIWQHSVMDHDGSLDQVLAGVGPRLRALRQQHDLTLADLAAATGISVSTLSRLESGQRRPTLELLLPVARAYQVPLDELISTAAADDPRVHALPFTQHGITYQPLTRRPGGLQAYKLVIPATRAQAEPVPQAHDGYEWLYVLSGRLRLVLGEHDLVLHAGEAAEFDTRVSHWFGRARREAVELLSLFSAQGERIHVRAAPRQRGT